MALGGAANAAVVVTSQFGAPDPGPNPGETYVITFDPTEAGVVLSGNYQITSGSASTHAAPAGDATNYLSVPAELTDPTSATMDFTGLLEGRLVRSFSFYWGSIDKPNTLELINGDGDVFFSTTGLAFPPSNGNQFNGSTNRRVTFTLTGADQDLDALRFSSSRFAFETDTFSFNAVPEPATWAMMILGFGGVGALMRRRRSGLALA